VQIQSDREQGSGVIIAKKGSHCTAATAGHVVRDNEMNYKVRTANGEVNDVTQVERFEESEEKYDIALVEFPCPNPIPIANLGDSNLPIFSEIYTAGYPTFLGFTFTEGRITSAPLSNGGILIHNADTEPGSSGSPIFNANREIVGIHFASKLIEAQPTGFKYAVSSNTLIDLIKQHPTWIRVSDLPKNPSAIARNSTLQIESTPRQDNEPPVTAGSGGTRARQEVAQYQ
jgi:S1-C subfamily serine protease